MQNMAYQSFDDFSGSSDEDDNDDSDFLKRKGAPLPKLRIPALPDFPQTSSDSKKRKRKRPRKNRHVFSTPLVRKKKKQHHRQKEFKVPMTPRLPPPPPAAEIPVAKVYSFVPYLRDLEERYEEAFRRKKSSYQSIPQIHEYYMESGRQKFLTHSNGDERLANLRQALKRLDTLGYMRSNHQREFHEVFISACLPQLYGKDLDRCLIRILEENDLDSIQSEVMVVTPRRWGKTMAVSLFLAAYLYTQPDADVCVYSIARRTSTMLVLKVYKMVVKLAGGTHVIKRSNQETLEVVNMYGGRSICNSYPAASKVLFFYMYFPFLSPCVCVVRKPEKVKTIKTKGKYLSLFFFVCFFVYL